MKAKEIAYGPIVIAFLVAALASCSVSPRASAPAPTPPPVPVAPTAAVRAEASPPAPWSYADRDQSIGAMAVDGRGYVYVAVGHVVSPDAWEAEDRKGRGWQPPEYGLTLLALDPAGRRRWSKRFDSRLIGAVGDVHLAVGGGRVVIAASMEGGIDFGGGRLSTRGLGGDVVVAAFDTAGSHVYTRRMGDEETQDVRSLGVLPDGTAVIAGRYLGELEPGVLPRAASWRPFLLGLGADGQRRFLRDDPVGALAVVSENELASVQSFRGALDLGTGPITASGYGSTVVSRFGLDGRTRWARELGKTDSWLNGSWAAATSDGGLLVAGTYASDIDLGGGKRPGRTGSDKSLFVVRLDAEGRFVVDYVTHRESYPALLCAAGAHGEVAFATTRIPSGLVSVVQLDRALAERSQRLIPAVALAFDPWGRLLVAHRHGISMLSPAGSWLDCQGTPDCLDEGRCTLDAGSCLASRAEDCAVSSGCAKSGHCQLVAGGCAAVSDADCAAAETCRDTGRCSVGDGQCVLSAQGCEATDDCRERGACSLVDNFCVRPDDYDCRTSPECRDRGRCAPIGDFDDCSVGSTADCRRSTGCREDGNCAATGNPMRGCEPASAADCRRSLSCRRHGRCTWAQDELGRSCALTTEAECRASDDCRERGRCTLVTFNGVSCEVRSEEDCKRSEACSKLGRCRLEARRCVK